MLTRQQWTTTTRIIFLFTLVRFRQILHFQGLLLSSCYDVRHQNLLLLKMQDLLEQRQNKIPEAHKHKLAKKNDAFLQVWYVAAAAARYKPSMDRNIFSVTQAFSKEDALEYVPYMLKKKERTREHEVIWSTLAYYKTKLFVSLKRCICDNIRTTSFLEGNTSYLIFIYFLHSSYQRTFESQ